MTLTKTDRTAQTMHRAAISSRLVASGDDRHFALRDIKTNSLKIIGGDLPRF